MFKNRHQLSQAKIFSVLCSLLIPFTAFAADLFSPSPVTPRNHAELAAWEVSEQYVVVDRSALSSNTFTVSLGGKNYTAQATPQFRKSVTRTNSQSGHLEGAGGSYAGTYTVSKRGNYGVFQVGRRTFEFKTKPNGLSVVVEKNHDALPSCPEGDEHHEHHHDFHVHHAEPTLTPIQRVDTVTIDVLVAYTPGALASAGSTEAMEAQIETAVSLANTAYENSGVDLQLRLVHSYATTDEASESFSSDLGDFADTTDGRFDEVHNLRDQYGADMVVLMREPGQYCGIGFRPYNSTLLALDTLAFSVVAMNCISYHSFAHELGHNLGAHHNAENAGGTPLYDDGYGEHWTSVAEEDAGTLYRSVMAYAPGTRVAHFSNPSVLHQGAPTGVNKETNNAGLLAASAPIVADYRDSVLSLTPTPGTGGGKDSEEEESGSSEEGNSPEVTYDLDLEQSGKRRKRVFTATLSNSLNSTVSSGLVELIAQKINRKGVIKRTVALCAGTLLDNTFECRTKLQRGKWIYSASWTSEDSQEQVSSESVTLKVRKRNRQRSNR